MECVNQSEYRDKDINISLSNSAAEASSVEKTETTAKFKELRQTIYSESEEIKSYISIEMDDEDIEDLFTMDLVSKYESKKKHIQLDENENEVRASDAEDPEAADEIDSGVVVQEKSNTYAAKKTVAQGMMDIALITANANQLRYAIEVNSASKTYYGIVTMISASLLLQIGVGIVLIMKGSLDIRGRSNDPLATRLSNVIVVGIFIITILNVFIASFTNIVSPRN